MALHGFNDDDIEVRESMQDFYGSDIGWHKEVLYEADIPIIEWRKLASRLNRGVQGLDDLYGAPGVITPHPTTGLTADNAIT